MNNKDFCLFFRASVAQVKEERLIFEGYPANTKLEPFADQND